MRKVLPLFVFSLFTMIVNGQTLFKECSFNEAQSKAMQTGKLIFLQLLSPKCSQCNEVAEKAFKDSTLIKKLNDNFICMQVSASHPDRKEIEAICNYNDGFGSYFFNQNKTLIHSYRMTTSSKDNYLTQIEIALGKTNNENNLTYLEAKFKDDSHNFDLLQMLLMERKSLGLETQALLDAYMDILPLDSLSSPRIVEFIMKMSPIVNTKPFLEIRQNMPLFNKVWNSIPIQDRVNINSRIIYNSRMQAIAQKNETFAYKIAAFSQSTYLRNSDAGKKAFAENMLLYFKGVGDTANYLSRTIDFYDTYFMTVSVDSIKKLDTILYAKIVDKAEGDTIFRDKQKLVLSKKVAFKPLSQTFSNNLNTGAWDIYNMSNEPAYLKKAITWAARGCEFFKEPGVLDTYARLLYKTGNKEEAIRNEKMAIEIQDSRNSNTTEFETVLLKMKKNLLLID